MTRWSKQVQLEPGMVGIKEAEAILGMSKPSIYRLMHAGKLPAYYWRSRLVFLRSELEAFSKTYTELIPWTPKESHDAC